MRLEGFAKQMRESPSLPEKLLWAMLERDPFHGIRFERQVVVGPYILDFFAPTKWLCVEVDGSHHFGRKDQDLARDRWLLAQGISTLRLPAIAILRLPRLSLEAIGRAVGRRVIWVRRGDQRGVRGEAESRRAKPANATQTQPTRVTEQTIRERREA